MTFAVNLPFGLMTMDDLIRILAIVGGAAVGGFLTGFLTLAIIRGYTGQQVPLWVAWTLRVLGAVALGYLTYLVVYNQGNGLFGGFGGGDGKDGTGKDAARETMPAVTTLKDNFTTTADKKEFLHILVFGDDPLQKMVKVGRIKSADAERCFRVEEDDTETLRTLDEVKRYLRDRLKEEPTLKRIEIVLYKDSPQENAGPVSALKKYADELTVPGKSDKVIVDFKRLGEPAPVR